MTMPFVSALPLRMPVPQNDMAGMLASWMDHSPALGLSSSDCKRDLETIDRLRRDIAQSLGETTRGQSENGVIEKLHEYYHFLLECEGHGMKSSSRFVSLEWESSAVVSTSGQQQPLSQLQTADSLESERANVIWNLAALEARQASKENLTTKLGWNKASKRLQNAASWLGHLLALLHETEKEQQQHEPPPPPKQTQDCPDFYFDNMSQGFVALWQALLLAQAQHCIYESLTCVKRPMQLLAAKLAAAAVPLYGEVEAIANNDLATRKDNVSESDLVPSWARFARAWGAYMGCKAEYHQSQIHREKKAWGPELARLDVAYQRAAICKNLCEENENNTNAAANNGPSQQPTTRILDELRAAVDDTLKLLKSRLDTAERENTEQHKQAIPTQHELTEIRGEKIVKCDHPLSKLLHPKTRTEAIFQQQKPSSSSSSSSADRSSNQAENIVGVHNDNNTSNAVTNTITKTNNNNNNNSNRIDGDNDNDDDDDDVGKATMLPTDQRSTVTPPQLLSSSSSSYLDKKKKAAPSIGMITSAPKSSLNLVTYVEVFKVEMNEIIEELARATEDQSESARLALNEVHLPHSLTAYQQEQSGGGLPQELWDRVQIIQQENRVMLLKQNLWELRDAADLARATHEKITSQLDFDVNSDRTFREANPRYEGHDAREVQRSFRKPLANYDKLLSSAQEGDSVLFRRLEQLDIEPKYNLLQFSKSQLDRLLPGAKGDSHDSMVVIDTQHLSYLCGELVTLFQKRDELMTMIRKEFHDFDIVGALEAKIDSTGGTDQDYLEATKHAQKTFDGIRYEIQANMERQNELLGTILLENDAFMNSRERTTNSRSAESCISMIEDAIEEIDQLSNHLKEGKDFYNVVVPKLDELKHQVDDVSARLTVEKLEYGEKEHKASQEQKDAEMAKQLNNQNSSQARTDEMANSSSAADASSSLPASEDPPNAASTLDDTTGAADTERESPSRSPENIGAPRSVAPRAGVGNVVDDEMVALLVAMGFDAEKAVTALEKHKNNVENAIADLVPS